MSETRVNIRIAPIDCWSCGAESHIVSSMLLMQSSKSAECSIADFTDYPGLVPVIETWLSESGTQTGKLKSRLSGTRGRAYMSNGCIHCDALFGQHYELHSRYEERLACDFVSDPSENWGAMLDALLASEDGHLFR